MIHRVIANFMASIADTAYKIRILLRPYSGQKKRDMQIMAGKAVENERSRFNRSTSIKRKGDAWPIPVAIINFHR